MLLITREMTCPVAALSSLPFESVSLSVALCVSDNFSAYHLCYIPIKLYII